MNEFSTMDLTGEAPAEICPDCARLAVEHSPTKTTILYCAHRLCGAYRATGRDWKVIKGVEAGIFSDIVLRGLTAGELRVELERDLLQILEEQARAATKH